MTRCIIGGDVIYFEKMLVPVTIQRNTGQPHNQWIFMSKLAFIKHFAFAGMGYAPTVSKLRRYICTFLYYYDYIHTFNQGHFVDPYGDPTAKGQFSNLAGKAIADFLSKRLDNSVFTVNYEQAMKKYGYSISGKRPDLLAFKSSDEMFAIEAKGFSKGGPGNMAEHKKQAQSGPIPTKFSVASVAYDMYREIKVNYWDPENDDFSEERSRRLWTELSKDYYAGLLTFLHEGKKINSFEHNGELFYVVVPRVWPSWWEWLQRWPRARKTAIILPENLKELADSGLPRNIEPFTQEMYEDELYIDNDRIGLHIII